MGTSKSFRATSEIFRTYHFFCNHFHQQDNLYIVISSLTRYGPLCPSGGFFYIAVLTHPCVDPYMTSLFSY